VPNASYLEAVRTNVPHEKGAARTAQSFFHPQTMVSSCYLASHCSCGRTCEIHPCDANDTRSYLRDVDRLRGVGRLWVLTGAGRPLRQVHDAVRNYLGTIGVRQDLKTFSSMTRGPVRIELYDLSDPTRLATTSAQKFSVPGMPRDPKISCRDWTKAEFDWHLDE